ncbi:MAG TPA: hypothetical protein VK436_08025 [Methanocella sp.]|nr:hypothetical protein [Methanocella sp.]
MEKQDKHKKNEEKQKQKDPPPGHTSDYDRRYESRAETYDRELRNRKPHLKTKDEPPQHPIRYLDYSMLNLPRALDYCMITDEFSMSSVGLSIMAGF